MLKKSALVCALAIAAPFAAHADGGTITFSGAVISSTCGVLVNNNTNSGQTAGNQTVTLPNAALSAFPTSSNGATIGDTPFSITVGGSGCNNVVVTPASGSTPAVTATGFRTLFAAGGTNISTAGRLVNLAASTPASGVGLQLLHDSGSGNPTVLDLSKTTVSGAGSQGMSKVSFNGTANASAPAYAASANFIVRYYQEGVNVTAGNVSSNVAYTVVYE